MERKTGGNVILRVLLVSALAFAFVGTVMAAQASAGPVSGITLINRTGGALTNLKKMVDDRNSRVFYAGPLEDGESVSFSNYDEWVFLWGTDESGREIQFCAEKEMSSGATVELHGEGSVVVR
jgi:hypothetical protein